MSDRVRGLVLAVAALSLLSAGVGRVDAAMIFSNFDSSGSFLVPYGATSSPVAQLSVGTTTTISNIAVLDQMPAGDLKFVIFDASNGNSLVFASASKAFGADSNGATFKMSDLLSFTLLSGHTYYVGAVSDVAASWNFDGTPNTQNGITSILANGNVGSFVTPVISGTGSFDSTVQLFSGSTAVPEPASIIILGTVALPGLVLVLMRWRRERASA